MDSTINELLAEAKELIREEMSELSFKTWIVPLDISSIIDNNIVLVARDSFKKEAAETRFKDLITNAFNIILQKNCNIEIVLKDDLQTKEEILQNFTQANISNTINYSNKKIKKSNKIFKVIIGITGTIILLMVLLISMFFMI